MDEGRKTVLSEELDAAIRQRDELNVVIDYLSKLVGRPGAGEQPGVQAGEFQTANPSAEPTSLVGEGEFFGKTSTEAATEVLTRIGRSRPLKTQEIFEALTKGGVKISQSALYRGLFRNPKFTRVGKSLWGLTEWYPPGVVRAARSERDPEATSLGLTPEDAGEDTPEDDGEPDG